MSDKISVKIGGKEVMTFPKGTDKTVIDQKVQEYLAANKPPAERAMDVNTTGLIRGVSNLPGIPNLIGQVLQKPGPVPGGVQEMRRMSGEPMDQSGPVRSAGEFLQKHTYSPQEISQGVFDISGIRPAEPQTPFERIQAAGASGTGTGFIGGPVGAVTGALSGVGGQSAAELGAPEWVQLLASIGVPLSGAGLKRLMENVTTSQPTKLLQQAAKSLKAPEFQKAAQTFADARAEGSKMTWAEAVASATDRGSAASRMLSLQRVAEASPGGQQILGDIMAARPAANEAMMARLQQQIGAMPKGQAASEVPQQMQLAAQGAMQEVNQLGTKLASPFYKAAGPKQVPEADLRQIIDDLNVTIDKTGATAAKKQLESFRDDLLADTKTGTSKLDIERLDSVRKFWRDKSELPVVAAEAVPKEVSAKITNTLNSLKKLMQQTSPEFETGRFVSQFGKREMSGPTERSPIGVMASEGSPTLKGQKAALLPRNPQNLDENTIRFTMKMLNRQEPEVARNWAQLVLKSEFDEAAKAFGGPTQQWGLDKFRLNMQANSQAAKNIGAVLRSLPNGAAVETGWKRIMEIAKGQGARERPGSMTAFNTETIEAMKAGNVPVGLLKPVKTVSDWFEKVRYERHGEELAKLLMAPSSQELLAAIAMSPKGGLRQNMLIGALFGGSKAEGAARGAIAGYNLPAITDQLQRPPVQQLAP